MIFFARANTYLLAHRTYIGLSHPTRLQPTRPGIHIQRSCPGLLTMPVLTPVTTQAVLVTVKPGDMDQSFQVPFTLGTETFGEHSSDEDTCSQVNDQPLPVTRCSRSLLANLQPYWPEIKLRASSSHKCHDSSEFLGCAASSSTGLVLHHSQLLMDKLSDAARRLKGVSSSGEVQQEEFSREVARDSKIGSVPFPRLKSPLPVATSSLPIDSFSSLSELS